MDSGATQWIPTYKNDKEVCLRIKMRVRKFVLMYTLQKREKNLHLLSAQILLGEVFKE